jgi:hypothetical protein
VSQRGGDWPLHVGAGGHAGGLGTGHRTSFGGGGIKSRMIFTFSKAFLTRYNKHCSLPSLLYIFLYRKTWTISE